MNAVRSSHQRLTKSFLPSVGKWQAALACIVGLIWGAAGKLHAEEAVLTDQIEPADTSTEMAPVPRGKLDYAWLRQQAVAKEVKPKEVVWLDVLYPGASLPTKMLALKQKPRKPQAQGGILLVHDANQHADWPEVIRPLRKQLPDDGWHTLAITLPPLSEDVAPERERGPKESDEIVLTPLVSEGLQRAAVYRRAEATPGEGASDAEVQAEAPVVLDAAPEPPEVADEAVDIDLADANEDTPPVSFEERALSHLTAGIEALKAEGFRNIIIIASGYGAETALRYVAPTASSRSAQGFAMVMVAPQLSDELAEDMSVAFGDNFKAPVLDLYEPLEQLSREQASERRIAAEVSSMANYSQVRLSGRDFAGTQAMLVRRISQWLLKHAPGMSAREYQMR